MLFTSFAFVFLVLLTFILYYLPFVRRFQPHVLVIASMIFYAHNSPALVLLLVWSVVVDIVTSYYIVHRDVHNKRLIATTGVIMNLGVLCFFKYSPMIGQSFFEGTSVGEFLVAVPLPIGISFFTFQGISLMVDVYKNSHNIVQAGVIKKNFWQHSVRSACYISFFSQLVAGPIVKAHEFMPQISDKYLSKISWHAAWHALVTGYFLKMVVADNLKDTTWWIDYPYFTGSSTVNLIFMLYGYSMQIFADFAGYSLIAIGIAHLFGYQLPQNFNFPYISCRFSEFWQRWHMSLSGFLKEYLYIPLGGNRKGKTRTLINLMITMTLGGLWHGARWSYAVWGIYHGLLLVIERIVSRKDSDNQSNMAKFGRWLIVFASVTLGWLLFKLPNFEHVIQYLSSMATNSHWPETDQFKNIILILVYTAPVVIYHVLYQWREQLNGFLLKIRPCFYGLMLFAIVFDSGTAQDFIYFQF